MERTPEAELMDDPAQARAYAEADFEAPHSHCLRLLRERFIPRARDDVRGRIVDLGCGPGDISLRLAEAFPEHEVIAIDAAEAMLTLARADARRRGLAGRVRFVHARVGDADVEQGSAALVFSNSLLHHLTDPSELWAAVARFAAPGAHVFVMDLMRPESLEAAGALTDRYAAGEPEVLRSDFHASLLAAYRPAEVESQLEKSDLAELRVEVVSDHHWIAHGEIRVTDQS